MNTSAHLFFKGRLLACTSRVMALAMGVCITAVCATQFSYAVYVTPYNAKQALVASSMEQVDQQLAVYDQFIQRYADSHDESKRIDVASVYFNKGKLLSENRRFKEASVAFETLIDEFADFQPVHVQVSYAYLGRMLIENELGYPQKALKTADTLIRYIGDTQEPSLRETLVKAWLAKSAIYAGLKQYKQAAATTRVVLQGFSGEKTAAMRSLLAQAYVDQIVFEANSSGLQPALKVFEQSVAYIGTDADLVQYLAYAYFNKGVAYRHSHHYKESLLAYDQMLARFADNQQVVVKNLVASAYSNQAENLVKLQKYPEAEGVIDQALARFSSSGEAALAQAIATLYNNKGFVLFVQAKQQWRKNLPQAQKQLQEARQNYETALGFPLIPGMSYASLYENYAYTMYLLGDKAVAEPYLAKALRIGGQDAYQAALDDIAIYRLAEDDGFKALLKRLWTEQNKKTDQ